MNITKDQLKQKLFDLEYYSNGFHKLSGTDVLIKNIRVRKNKVVYDVTLIDDMESGHTESFRDCWVSKAKLEQIQL